MDYGLLTLTNWPHHQYTLIYADVSVSGSIPRKRLLPLRFPPKNRFLILRLNSLLCSSQTKTPLLLLLLLQIAFQFSTYLLRVESESLVIRSVFLGIFSIQPCLVSDKTKCEKSFKEKAHTHNFCLEYILNILHL